MAFDPAVVMSQLGGTRRLQLMTGAKHFAFNSEARQVNIQLPKSRGVRVTLEPTDTYRVEVLHFSTPRQYAAGKPLYRVTRQAEGVYAEQLAPTFTRLTGLALSL